MRLLCTFVGGNGHFQPLVPVARAAADAGHTVAFSGESLMVPTIEAAGFPAFASGPDYGSTGERKPLLPVDREREANDLREGFARRAATQRADDLLRLCADWTPDLILCDEADFGAMIAAEHLGLPCATVLVMASGSFVRPEIVGPALDEVRAAHTLPADAPPGMSARHLVLNPFPPAFRDPDFPLPPTARTFRAETTPVTEAPHWRIEGRPTVYFTLGTIFNTESGDLFTRVLDGLAELPVTAVVTVGPVIDPAEFGPQPGHIHLARYLPQHDVLPHCDAVLTHGGSGSVLGALAHGLPQVLVPMGADQPNNGDRVTALRLGKVLDPITVTPAEIRDAVTAVLDDDRYRRNAARFAAELAAQPPAEETVSWLEGLLAAR
ncbi:glycosyltransferase [Amycolatopsis sp. NPDC059027]|uniref:glycosyltransferase n=1 Tax=unclassified Amycolatopsis TaxID=2618356 RepID=UPI003671FCD8